MKSAHFERRQDAVMNHSVSGEVSRFHSWLSFFWSWLPLLRTCTARRFLLWQLTQRFIMAAYKVSSLGAVWMVLKPLFTFGIYLVVFGLIFKVRWSTAAPDSLGFSFVLPLLTGVAIHEYYASLLVDSCSILTDNRNYIKKVAFPLELLPVALTGRTLLTFCIYLLIIGVAVAISKGAAFRIELVFLLPILFALVISGLAIALFCSALGLFFPDLKHANEVAARVLFFVAPIFYPLDQVSPGLRALISLNPLTQVIELTRQCVLWGEAPPLSNLFALVAGSWLALCLGYLVFSRCRKGFADVI